MIILLINVQYILLDFKKKKRVSSFPISFIATIEEWTMAEIEDMKAETQELCECKKAMDKKLLEKMKKKSEKIHPIWENRANKDCAASVDNIMSNIDITSIFDIQSKLDRLNSLAILCGR